MEKRRELVLEEGGGRLTLEATGGGEVPPVLLSPFSGLFNETFLNQVNTRARRFLS